MCCYLTSWGAPVVPLPHGTGKVPPTGPCFVVAIGDKGHPSLANVVADRDGDDPYVAKHGSVSVSVSFHTFATMFQRHVQGGFALVADPSPR